MSEMPSFKVENVLHERTIRLRLTGLFDEPAMRAFVAELLRVTDEYRGGEHFVLADMRGMKPASQEVARIMGEGIGRSRQRGVACCVHLSDSTITRLQTRRVARENSPGDDVTVDVASEAEAERVLAERREQLRNLREGWREG